MRKRNKRIFAGVIFAAAAAVLTGCGIAQGKTLTVGVKDDVANFGLYDKESGRYSGMEIDLAQQICDDLGYENLELVTVSSTTREKMIESGEVDMVIATYSVTDERAARFDFSIPYYTDHVAVMVEESSLIKNFADLAGCRVGVMKNTSHKLSMTEYMAQKGMIPEESSPDSSDAGVTFVEYSSYDEVSKALEYGEVDAFVADRSILSGYQGDGRVVLPDEFSEQEYGVCTQKGSALSGKVNEALQARMDDGTIDELIKRWGN